MKKAAGRSRKKSSRPKRKTIMRHSREGVRSRRKSGSKPKPKPKPKRKIASKSRKTKKSPAKRKTKSARTGPRRRPVDMDSARDVGFGSAGQSGDIEGLSSTPSADSESVEELVEEGQAFEAGVVEGVENAPPARRRGGVRTRQVPEDDVPPEYFDEK
jgi:hypothetical protein